MPSVFGKRRPPGGGGGGQPRHARVGADNCLERRRPAVGRNSIRLQTEHGQQQRRTQRFLYRGILDPVACSATRSALYRVGKAG